MSELDGRLAVLNPHLHDGVPLAEAARRAGVPRRTATRWLAAYQSNGLEGLRRFDRADRGGRRLPQEMIELIEGMALRRPPPKAAEVHRTSSVRSVVRSSTVCRARKTLPCQRNHFTRCSSWVILADLSDWQRRPLASWVSTVIRIVRWNQSSRCSACGLR